MAEENSNVSAEQGSMRFKAPPGWPTPPAGWTPPPGWQPDPRWPKPPPGWRFWEPIRSPGARSSKVRIIIGAIGFIATLTGIAGFVLAVIDRPKPFTVADWAREANAVCEETHGSLRQQLRSGLAATSVALVSLQTGKFDKQQMDTTATALEDLADAERKIIGGLRKIKNPENHEADVTRTLSYGADLARGFDRVAADLRRIDPNDPAVQNPILDATTTVQSLSVNTLPNWTNGLRQLNATSCTP